MAEVRRALVAAQAAIVDRATAQVVDAMRRRGIRCILLKGPALERWLYDGDPREYVDVDLLVAPHERAGAEAVLRELGYARALEDTDVPPFDRELHAHTWRAASGPAVDLHRTLPEAAAPPDAVWAAVSRETETLPVDGAEIEVLALPARALLVALHAAHHGALEPKPLDDLARALDRLDPAGWAAAAGLAAQLGATEPFAAALRLLPAGAALADELDLPATSSAEVALRASSPVPLALHLEWLAQARGPRAKLRLLARLVFPPRAFVEPPPGTPRPRLALARAYARRIAKLRHAPAALAYRRSTRSKSTSIGESRSSCR